MNLSFTCPIPVTAFLFVGSISSFIVLFVSKDLRKTASNVSLCVVFGLFCFYLTVISPFIGVIVYYPSLWICSCSIILLTPDKKKRLLSIFTTGTAIIIAISLPAWILYLLGCSLPHGTTFEHPDGFHILTNYYFFLLNGYPGDTLIPRFASMFLEPGQLATPCVFLIFANGCNFRNIKVILLLLAVIFSFSLAGYGMLVGGLLLSSFFNSNKYRIFKGFLLLSFFATVTIASIRFFDETSLLNKFIISRLEYDEDKGIVGNNRTTYIFDYKFEQMMSSHAKYFGIAKDIDQNSNWTSNTSGIKKYIVYYGLIGLFFLFIFCILLLAKNWSISSAIFFIVVIVGFIPRSMLLSPYWLFICLTAIPVLAWQNKMSSKEIV